MKVNTNEFRIKPVIVDSVFFTTKQHGTISSEEKRYTTPAESETTYAKKIKKKLSRNFNGDSGYSFFIKATPNKELYNPFQIHSSLREKQTYETLNKVCKIDLSFLEVSESIFNDYVNFLSTENKKFLTKAQREIG